MDALLLILEKAVIPLLAAVLAAALPILVRKLLALLEAKVGVQIAKDKKDLLDKLARDAVLFAEQQALNAVTKKRGKLSSEDKAALAVQWVLDQADKLGLDDVATQALVDLVEAKVGELNFT